MTRHRSMSREEVSKLSDIQIECRMAVLQALDDYGCMTHWQYNELFQLQMEKEERRNAHQEQLLDTQAKFEPTNYERLFVRQIDDALQLSDPDKITD